MLGNHGLVAISLNLNGPADVMSAHPVISYPPHSPQLFNKLSGPNKCLQYEKTLTFFILYINVALSINRSTRRINAYQTKAKSLLI